MKGFILPARGKNILLVLLGNALYALAVDMFVLPCGLITGGTTGLALATRYWLDVPVAGFVLVSNIIMFVVGAVAMGRWFAFNTALSTFCYPLFLDLFARIPGIDGFTRDPMLGTIFAGVLIGVAIGLVIGAGASSGKLSGLSAARPSAFRDAKEACSSGRGSARCKISSSACSPLPTLT